MGFGLTSFAVGLQKTFNLLLAILLALLNSAGVQVSIRGHYDSLSDLVSYSFYDSTYKIPQAGIINKKDNYTIYLAKNEREGCQIAFRMRVNRTATRVTLSEFKDENGNVLPSQLYKVDYVLISNRETVNNLAPDPMIPIIDDRTFPVKAENSVPYYIEVRSTKDTPAGDYTATITFENTKEPDNERENKTVEVKAHVWDFTLPETPSSQTSIGIHWDAIAKAHGVESDSQKAYELYDTYYEYFLDHKLSPYTPPPQIDIMSEEAEKYLNDPRLTTFQIPYSSDDATLQKYYARVQENPEWAKKGYFSPDDEPTTAEDFKEFLEIYERLNRLCPGFEMRVAYSAGNKVEIDGKEYTTTELEAGRSSILCPLSSSWDNKGAKEELYAAKEKYGSRLWWYVCDVPQGDYCNINLKTPEGLRQRLLFWQQKSLGIEGFLHWSFTYWYEVGYDPWSSMDTLPDFYDSPYGEGSLLYNGNRVGVDGPVPSMRFKAVADGLEDYDYLTMAEELLGEKYMDKMIGKVTKDLTTYTYSDSDFAKVRIELGNELEKAVNAQ